MQLFVYFILFGFFEAGIIFKLFVNDFVYAAFLFEFDVFDDGYAFFFRLRSLLCRASVVF